MEILKTRRDIAPPEREARKVAVFMDGENFNVNIIAGYRSNITEFYRLTERFPGQGQYISAPGSPYPILCWIPASNPGPLYWFCEADYIFLNANSRYMFQGFSIATELDFTGITAPANLADCAMMFEGCHALTRIIAPAGFVAPSSSSDMFYNCFALVGGAGTAYDSDHTDGTYARIDNPPDEPGYFTSPTA